MIHSRRAFGFAIVPFGVVAIGVLGIAPGATSCAKHEASGGFDSGDDDGGQTTTPNGATVHVYQTSAAGDHLADEGTLDAHDGAGTAGRTTITVDVTKPRQEITGFGGALTESSASALAALPADARKQIIDAYFSAAGSGYTLARVPIASCDFSLASYQYSLVADPTLADFSIDHDRALLLPLVKDAVASAAGALNVLASPWSAPAWMKSPAQLYVKPTAANNYQGQDPVLQTKYYDAYALYLSKYIQAYGSEGVKIWAITPQNEPLGNGGNWETMSWTSAGMKTFIRDNLGPRLKTDGLDTHIVIYDHNKGTVDGDMVLWVKDILSDPQAAQYVYGTGAHWYGSTNKVFEASLDAVHAADTSKVLLATEATIDGLTDKQGAPASAAYQYSWMKDAFYWTADEYDWGFWYAPDQDRPLHPAYQPVYRYARDIIVGLNHWYTGWIDWNIVLTKDGGPNHEKNWCAAGVLIDPDTKTPYYTPIFYVMQQFSKFIRPGAKIVPSSVALASSVAKKDTEGLIAVASTGTDGNVTTVLFNETAAPIDYSLVVGGEAVDGTIPAQSIQTLAGLAPKP